MLDKLVLFFLVSAVLGVAVSYSKLYLFHIALMILVLYTMYIVIKNKKVSILKNRIKSVDKSFYFVYIFFIWYLLSYFWIIEDSGIYAKYIFYIICAVSIMVVMVFYIITIEKLKRVYQALSIIFFIELILSLLELHPNFMLPIAPSSTLVEYFGRTMASNSPTIPTGFNWNQNDFASVLVMLLGFVLFIKNIYKKVLMTFLILVLLVAAGSMGNLIAGGLVLFLYTILFKKQYILTISLIIAIVVGFPVYKNILPSTIKTKFEHIDDYTTKFLFHDSTHDKAFTSGKSKQLGFKAILNRMEKEDLFYIGLGAGQGRLAILHSEIYPVVTNVHNFWFEQFANGGLLYFIIFFSWYISLIYRLFKLGQRESILKYYAKATSLSLMGLSVSAFVPSSMIYMFPLWLLFGFAMAILNLDKQIKSLNYV